MGKKRKRRIKPFTRERLRTLVENLSYIYMGIGIFLFVLGGIAVYFSIQKELVDRPSLYASNKAWSYFYPRWSNVSFVNYFDSTRDEADKKLSKEFVNFHKIVRDPKNRIDNRFTVPKVLTNRVLFWVDVYARYDSRIRIVHDRDNVGIVYGYIDFRPLYRRYRSRPLLAYKKSRQIEKQILSQLKHLMKRIQYGQELSSEGIALQSYLKSRGLYSRIPNLKYSIRTQTGQKDKFQVGILRSKKLMPHIESVFKDYRLPKPLTRIPFVESSFNPRAYSKVGARGLWQIMPATARQLISRDRSLWMDPMRQTKAAAKLLRQYRRILPDWGTTITAYNSGVGRVQKLLKKYRAKNYTQLFLRVRGKDLGFAGKNFYAEFLAANLVEAYKEDIFKLLVSPTDVAKIYRTLAPFDEELCQVR